MSQDFYRSELHSVLAHAGRSLGKASVMLNAACAETLGLHVTEWECIGLLLDSLPEPLTAGQIAELTGLTTGAVTGVLDRLEAKRWILRRRDPDDRRRVIVTLQPGRVTRVLSVLAGMTDDMLALQDEYPEDLLRACAGLLVAASDVLRDHALALRSGATGIEPAEPADPTEPANPAESVGHAEPGVPAEPVDGD
jgi:DNA-binding MarR family transcriptional regulator